MNRENLARGIPVLGLDENMKEDTLWALMEIE